MTVDERPCFRHTRLSFDNLPPVMSSRKAIARCYAGQGTTYRVLLSIPPWQTMSERVATSRTESRRQKSKTASILGPPLGNESQACALRVIAELDSRAAASHKHLPFIHGNNVFVMLATTSRRNSCSTRFTVPRGMDLGKRTSKTSSIIARIGGLPGSTRFELRKPLMHRRSIQALVGLPRVRLQASRFIIGYIHRFS